MGYTHYWSYPPEAISAMQAMILCQDARQIVVASGVPIVGWESAGESAPEFNPESRIALNGDGAQGCETFAFDFHAPQEPSADADQWTRYRYDRFIEADRYVWSFCKTRQRPYDAVVTAILLRSVEIIGDMMVASDGCWDDWSVGRGLYFTVFGQEAVCPWEGNE
jgi:hypothetical protein